jgi:uncharacterized protein (DUF302 family)
VNDVDENDVTTKLSTQSVSATVEKFVHLLETKGLKLFAVIDQRAEARSVGLELREMTLVIFGSPSLGTPVMDAAPLSGLDLPLKVLIWAEGYDTKVSYLKPRALATRHNLSVELLKNLSGIDELTNALVGE